MTHTAILATLKTRTALTGTESVSDIEIALASMITKAGGAMSPLKSNAVSTLDAILTLHTLTQERTNLLAIWLGLRALSLKAGNTVGVDVVTLENPLFDALVSAAGLLPTTNTKTMADGALFCAHPSKGRSVVAKNGTMTIKDATGTLIKMPFAKDPKGALAMIDALTITRTTNAPQAIAYSVQNDTQSPTFSASIFAPYKVSRLTIADAVAHPNDLVESAALASVRPPVPSYKPHFLPSVVRNGILSDVQLETIIYAGEAHSRMLLAHPNDGAMVAPRQGFLVGHGTGVGKGRIIAGIIADNWAQGKRRHLWLSETATLIDAAREDWEALGGRKEDIIDIRDLPIGAPVNLSSGILFATYAALRSTHENGTRLDQICAWMGQDDGVVAFDESQNLRNSITHTGESGWDVTASAQGIAATKLQDRLPNSRVLYVSATSASDIISMGYAVRLGLWGNHTAFKDADAFFRSMNEGGTNALEMVARDLKAMGLYLAANVSFDGVKYEHIEHQMTDLERNTHNVLSEMWCEIAAGLKTAVHTTGVLTGPKKGLSRTNRTGDIQFNMARARFFQATIAAMKTPMVIENIRKDLANGHSAVVQLANTFEANLDKALLDAQERNLSLDHVDSTPRDILLNYLDRDFPIIIHEATKVNGQTRILPKLDANGEPMVCPRAFALREQFKNKVRALPIPEGPLEQLFNAFGSSAIAEATGRKKRLVRLPNGTKVLEDIAPDAIKREVAAFMNDQKQILVFSDAGATGATYSAARTRANQRLRRHYVLQAGWRADKAIQGMGRTHRSNQKQPPEYILPAIDLWADQRMISRVAKGMRDLGAITRGLRQAASQDFFTQEQNLEDEFGQQAWYAFVQKLAAGDIHGLSLGQFALEANIPLSVNGKVAIAKQHIPPVRRFLNAMSAMSYNSQQLFGRAYKSELDKLRLEAVASGQYDRGIETIRPDSLIKLEDAVIYKDPRTGGETRLLKMLRIDSVEPLDFATARSKAIQRGNASVVTSLLTGRIAILSFPKSLRELAPKPDDIVHVYTPTGARQRTRAEVVAEGWQRVEGRLAQDLWNAEAREQNMDEEKMFWVVTGAMLPIWDKLPRERSIVFRMETDEAEQIIGRIVSETFVGKLLKTVDALTNGGLPDTDVLETLENSGIVQLANGWQLVGRFSQMRNAQTVRLVIPADDAGKLEVSQAYPLLTVQATWDQQEITYSLGEPSNWMPAIRQLLKISVAVTAATL